MGAAGKAMISVEVVYATTQAQHSRQVSLPAGATLAAAIAASGLAEELPEIDLERLRVGVFGRLAQLQSTVADGDRVEIYRPLPEHPNARRRRQV